MSPTRYIVLADGEGRHLSGTSRADVSIGGRRPLDRVMAGARPFVFGRIAAVTPDLVDVPSGVFRTLEDPPAGGPLAGTGAGLKALGASAASTRAAAPTRAAASADPSRGASGSAVFMGGSVEEPSAAAQDMAFVFAVDTPQTGTLVPRLAAAARGRDGAVAVDGKPSFRQCLQAIYRIEILRTAIEEAGGPRNRGVRRMLAGLDLAEVPSSADECRDIDTLGDVPWWSKALGSADSDVAFRGSDP